jgi:hypothetical protein
MVKSWWRRVDGSLKITGFIVGPEKKLKVLLCCIMSTSNSSGNGFVLYDKFKQKSQERKWMKPCMLKKTWLHNLITKNMKNKSKILYWYGVSLPSFLPSFLLSFLPCTALRKGESDHRRHSLRLYMISTEYLERYPPGITWSVFFFSQ